MFIFLRFLLAHLIGDFPLQSRSVYRAKVKNIYGKMIHATIVGLTMAALNWPYFKVPLFWGIILINILGHFLQDWFKLQITQKIKNPNNFFVFMVDQLLHIATLALIFLTPLGKEISPFRQTSSSFIQLYNNHRLIVFLICLMTVSFAGTFILATFKSTFFPERFSTPYLEPLEKAYGILERSLMFFTVLFIPWGLALLPFFLIPKFFFANFQMKRLKGNAFTPFLIDTFLGMLLVLSSCPITYRIIPN
ncbi:MAG: DUF3307 domain-containing protein [Chlamydiae bacterium]|nr:DUF3307 domain-containing protein [Chlamydiota bacterium]MBI3277468.1 DUF3307 domain-containing protein [Chlamydiota bacterium]